MGWEGVPQNGTPGKCMWEQPESLQMPQGLCKESSFSTILETQGVPPPPAETTMAHPPCLGCLLEHFPQTRGKGCHRCSNGPWRAHMRSWDTLKSKGMLIGKSAAFIDSFSRLSLLPLSKVCLNLLPKSASACLPDGEPHSSHCGGAQRGVGCE